MLTFAPSPQDDELIYSYLGRWFVLSGLPNRRAFMDRSVGADFRLLTPDVYGQFNIETKYSLVLDRSQILLNHTLFPFYAQFLPEALIDKVIQACWEGDQRISRNWLDRSDLTPRSLRFCMECAKEQLRDNGYIYWTRPHNLPFVRACYRHETVLVPVLDNVLERGPEQFVFPEIDERQTVKATENEIRLAIRACDTLHEEMGVNVYSTAVKRIATNRKNMRSQKMAQVKVQLRQDLLSFRTFAMDCRYACR